jgi:hypothetical protein
MSHLAFVAINYERATTNPHTNLLNVFIQIANNKGILYKKNPSGRTRPWGLLSL